MYLLDTNVISELRRPRPHGAVLAWLEGVDDHDLHLSAVTLGELQAGVEITREQDPERAAQIESWIDEQGERRVRMATLAVVASHKVNGVSALHSRLCVETIFADFAKLYPERFTNVTNGVTPRRWLMQANPALSAVIDGRIGTAWRLDLGKHHALRASFRPIDNAVHELLIDADALLKFEMVKLFLFDYFK